MAEEDDGRCPLTTEELVQVVVAIIKAYNARWMYLYSYQIMLISRIIESLLLHDADTITGLFSRQAGKSSCLAALAPGLCLVLPALGKKYPKDPRVGQYANGFKMAIFAPVKEKASIIFDPVRERAGMKHIREQFYADPSFCVSKEKDPTISRGDRVGWSNGSFVVTRTASDQVNTEGDTFHLVILDEAQRIPEYKVSKEIRPMLSSTLGSIVKIGTADVERGGFYKSIVNNLNRERKGYKKTHFEFPWEDVCSQKLSAYNETKDLPVEALNGLDPSFHLNYQKAVLAELENDHGGNRDAPAFRLNYRLLWQDANTGAVDMTAFYAGADQLREANEPTYHCRQVAALDFGKIRDATVLTVAEIDPRPIYETMHVPGPVDQERKAHYKKTIIAWYVISGKRWDHITSEAVRILAGHVVDTLVCDATGVGDPVTEMLQSKAPYLNIIPFTMSAKGNDLVYKLYLAEIEAGRWHYCAGPETEATPEYLEFVRQHEVLKRDRGEIYIRCSAPEGDHDDFVDSAALCCYAAELPAPEEGEVTSMSVVSDNRGWHSSASGSREDRYRRARA